VAVQLPLREADLYPLSQTRAGITAAVDEITSADRAKDYFGVDLIKEGLLPINIIVSNHGEHRFTIKPSDVLLLRGKEVIDPVPTEMVAGIAKRGFWGITEKTAQRIDGFFVNLALKEAVLIPGETYQGVLFFRAIKGETEENRFFTIMRLFREGGLRLQVAITDLETNERVHFGPFVLSSL
jgi:hypothetical protein